MTENEAHAILGGGCFWCLEPVFSALRGLHEVQPGYCGGHVPRPRYEQVCQGHTGHVEVVRLSYDPGQIGYDDLLRVFFDIHDPTSKDRQGNDVGPQYASVIFYLDNDQKEQALAMRQAVQAAIGQQVHTRVESAGTFWPAEAVHKDYFQKNPSQPYCRLVIAPKMADFRRQHANLLA